MALEDEKPTVPTWSGRRSVKSRFGERLHELRTARGYTQMELAIRSKMDRSFLSDLERGVKEPTLTTLQTLADAFSLTLSEMLDRI